jgi:hypothetical protein
MKKSWCKWRTMLKGSNLKHFEVMKEVTSNGSCVNKPARPEPRSLCNGMVACRFWTFLMLDAVTDCDEDGEENESCGRWMMMVEE